MIPHSAQQFLLLGSTATGVEISVAPTQPPLLEHLLMLIHQVHTAGLHKQLESPYSLAEVDTGIAHTSADQGVDSAH